MQKVVLFGIDQNSQVVASYLLAEKEVELLAFCVDDLYLPDRDRVLMNKPIMALSDLQESEQINTLKMLAPLYGSKMGQRRQEVYERLKRLGFHFTSYISKQARLYTDQIGENVIILDGNTIQPFVEIGDNVSLWSNNHIGHHSRVASNTSITSHVVISGNCIIGRNCFLGVNSGIANGIELADYTFVGMGASVTKSTLEGNVITANPSETRKMDSRRLVY